MVTDYRVGDLALVDGEIQIINLSMLYHMEKNPEQDRIQPLELTEEVMEIMGFSYGLYGVMDRETDKDAVVRWSNGQLSIAHTPRTGFCIEVTLQPFMDKVKIRHAHQLQQIHEILAGIPIIAHEIILELEDGTEVEVELEGNDATGWAEIVEKHSEEGEG